MKYYFLTDYLTYITGGFCVFLCLFFLLLFSILEIKPEISHMLGNISTMASYAQPLSITAQSSGRGLSVNYIWSDFFSLSNQIQYVK